MIKSMLAWVWENKEWLFSGIGVVILLASARMWQWWGKRRMATLAVPGSNSGTVGQSFPGESRKKSSLPFHSYVETLRSLNDRFLERDEFLKSMQEAEIDWVGFLVSAHEGINDTVSVMISKSSEPDDFLAAISFPKEWKTKLYSLRKGDQVHIRGVFEGSFAPIMIRGSFIERVL